MLSGFTLDGVYKVKLNRASWQAVQLAPLVASLQRGHRAPEEIKHNLLFVIRKLPRPINMPWSSLTQYFRGSCEGSVIFLWFCRNEDTVYSAQCCRTRLWDLNYPKIRPSSRLLVAPSVNFRTTNRCYFRIFQWPSDRLKVQPVVLALQECTLGNTFFYAIKEDYDHSLDFTNGGDQLLKYPV